jgi:hypothetical protein
MNSQTLGLRGNGDSRVVWGRDRLATWSVRGISVLLVCLIGWLGPAALCASEQEIVSIADNAGVYQISLKMLLDIPAQQVWEGLTDYRHIYRLNPSIVESRLLPAPDGGRTARVFTRIQGCIGFYCREFSRVEDVWERPPREIETRTVPDMSDFHSGSARWRIRDLGGRTELHYEATLEPAFFVPPVVGGYVLKRKLKEEILLSFDKIECLARVKLAIQRDSGVAHYAQMLTGNSC